MKTETENLSAEQSLNIITSMIQEAKGKVQQHSAYFILWGWVVAVGNLGMFVLMQLEYDNYFMIWTITIPAWIWSIYRGFSTRRTQGGTVSHFDKISGALWICFGVVVFTLIGFGGKINYQLGPVILLVSSLPTFISGLILRFRPLMYGGAFFWLCSIVSFMVPMPYQSLVGAVAIVFGYLLPAYILKNKRSV